MITVPDTICNKMNAHFVEIGKKIGVQMVNTNDKTNSNFLGKRHVSSVYFRPTENQDIIEIIACLNIRQSLAILTFQRL